MAIKNTKLGGTNWDTPTARIKPTDLNDTFDEVADRLDISDTKVKSDQTGGSYDGTAETKIGEVLVSANDVSNGVLIIATGLFDPSISTPNVDVRLRTGTSATATSNTLRKTINRVAGHPDQTAWTIVFALTTEEDWTTDTYIHITSQSSNITSNNICESIVVTSIVGTF